MRSVAEAVDWKLEAFILRWAHRRWPLLRLVPDRWMRPLVMPAAARLRRSVSRAVLVVAVVFGLTLALLILAT